MDLMEIRREMMGVIAQMGNGNNLLWKTVILEADRITDGSGGRTDLWFTFLGVSEQDDLEQYAYVCFFSNNNASSYSVEFILWTKDNGNNACVSARSGWSAASSWNRSAYATAGTQIDIYRIPKQHET